MDKERVHEFYDLLDSLFKEVYVVFLEQLGFRTVVLVVAIDNVVDKLHFERNVSENDH